MAQRIKTNCVEENDAIDFYIKAVFVLVHLYSLVLTEVHKQSDEYIFPAVTDVGLICTVNRNCVVLLNIFIKSCHHNFGLKIYITKIKNE